MCDMASLWICLSLLYLYTIPAGTNALHIDPPRVVVSYGDPVSANCSTNDTYLALDWERAYVDTKMIGTTTITWTVEELKDFDAQAFCYMANTEYEMHVIQLNITVYKTPDKVSISTVGHSGLTIEGRQYELLCNIQNVAPVEFLTVRWYKGDTLVSNTTFSDSTKTPVNRSTTLQITPSTDDDGAQYRCVAELDLGPDGPQPPPTVRSDLLIITIQGTTYLHIDPPRVVVSYGDPVSVNCSTNAKYLRLDWEKAYGDTKMIGTTTITWTVEELKDFDAQAFCYMVDNEYNVYQIELNITVYKTPDKVTLSTVGHTGPMIEGRQYELLCDIQDVAPVKFLTVSWFKGDTLVSNTTFSDPTKTPVNPSSKLQINPSRDDDRAQYRCVAELDLGPDGPQPPPTVRSDPLIIAVYDPPY